MNIIPMYDRFVYCWFVHVNIKPSLVIGWFEMELLSDLSFLWSVLYEEGDRVVNCCNCVDFEAMCGLMRCDMKCMNALCVNSFSRNMLRDVIQLILETLDVFPKKISFRKFVLHVY